MGGKTLWLLPIQILVSSEFYSLKSVSVLKTNISTKYLKNYY
jgi:hypothetical protein